MPYRPHTKRHSSPSSIAKQSSPAKHSGGSSTSSVAKHSGGISPSSTGGTAKEPGGGGGIDQYQLYDQTVWASGQNAKKNMKRFKKVPLVTWTKEAAQVIKNRWHAVQHRAKCERVLWMTTWNYGKTSAVNGSSSAIRS